MARYAGIILLLFAKLTIGYC